MRVLGDWLVPHLNGAIYSEKPPLFFWLSALGQALGLGFNAGRVVAGLASLGTLLVTWALARRFLGDRAALLGACVLGTAVFFPWLSRFGVLDVVLTFFVTVAVYGWIRGGPWVSLFYAGMGLAVLVKGPVGIVLALFAAVAWRVSGGSGGPRWHPLWGVPLTLAIVAAWLVPACLRGGPEYTDAILWKQNVGRAVESWSHARPFWYYVPYLGLFFPWVLFLPWAAPWAWRRKGLPRAMLLWAAVGFVFFSIVSGKRDRYLTPLFPPLAIVVGAWLDGASDALANRWIRIAARIATGFLIGAAFVIGSAALAFVALALGLVRVSHMDIPSPAWFLAAFVLAGLLYVVALRGIGARREGRLQRVAALVALGMAILMFAYDLLLVPRINEFKSPRPVAEALNAWPGEVAAYPAHFSGAYNLYSGRLTIPVLDTPEDVAAYLAGPGTRLVLTSQESYRRGDDLSLGETLARRFRVEGDAEAPAPPDPAAPRVWRKHLGRVGHREMLFLTNYEPPP
jgi:4-amino-4-deoxy-L-arabinose transferase-like glycosyltransferase